MLLFLSWKIPRFNTGAPLANLIQYHALNFPQAAITFYNLNGCNIEQVAEHFGSDRVICLMTSS
jgi:hypothetical protein